MCTINQTLCTLHISSLILRLHNVSITMALLRHANYHGSPSLRKQILNVVERSALCIMYLKGTTISHNLSQNQKN